MPVTCPAGHQSESTDYCDTCGAAIAPPTPGAAAAVDPAEGTAAMPAVTATSTCPNCGAPRQPDEVFCEVCGLDFATGQLPAAPAPAAPAADPAADPAAGPAAAATPATTEEWVAVVEADRRYFDTNQAESPGSAVEFPADATPREVPLTASEVLIGRRSDSKGIFPDIDLSSPVPDAGVSRRHAVLRRQPEGDWVLIDQGSTNGTTVRGAATPVKAGEAVRVHDGDHFHVGAWTRITLRKVAPKTGAAP